jgi:hypothetical protein
VSRKTGAFGIYGPRILLPRNTSEIQTFDLADREKEIGIADAELKRYRRGVNIIARNSAWDENAKKQEAIWLSAYL